MAIFLCYDSFVPRYVSCEGLSRPGNQDFDQSRGSNIFEPTIVIQGLLLAPDRNRKVIRNNPLGLSHRRQSRQVTVFNETSGRLGSYPSRPGQPDIGISFSRRSVLQSPIQRTTPEFRQLVATTLHQTTTLPLSGLPPLHPTHHPDNSVAINPTPTEFKLETLTNNGGGLSSSVLRQKYRDILAARENTMPSPIADDFDPIPWE